MNIEEPEREDSMPLTTQASVEETVLEEDTEEALRYFQADNTLLWFDQIPAIRGTVIPEPMTLIKAFRGVLNHNVKNSFQGVKFKEVRNDLKKGLISRNNFSKLYKSGENSSLPEEKCWQFLIELGLVLPLTDKGEDQIVLIPSIISDETEPEIQKELSEMESPKESVCVQYTFDKHRRSLKSFPLMLKRFTDQFLWDNGGQILLSYSQKIERRKLGLVRGIQGYLKWQSEDEVTTEPKE